MYTHEIYARVSYAETDQMGYMYYGNYARHYEIGRVEAIRALGISYKKLEKDYGIMMPVVHVEARFLMPAVYDELLTIRTIISDMPTKMIQFNTEIFNEQIKSIHKATVKLFFVEISSGKRVSAPQYLTDCLKPHFK